MEIGIDVKGKYKDLQINSGALAVLTHLSYIPITFPPKTGTQLHVLPHPRQCLRESFVSTLICGQCLKFEGTGQDPHAEHVWDGNYTRALVQTYGYQSQRHIGNAGFAICQSMDSLLSCYTDQYLLSKALRGVSGKFSAPASPAGGFPQRLSICFLWVSVSLIF